MAFPDLPPKRSRPPLKAKSPRQYETARVSMQQERLIGRVVVVWSKIESTLDEIIWTLSNLDFGVGRYLTRPFGADGKIKLIRSLSKNILLAEMHDESEKMLNSVGNCQDDRNFIVHAAWGTSHIDPFAMVPLAISTRPKSDPDVVIGETFPPERMHTITTDGMACLRALNSFLDALETSPEKFRRQHPQG
jgi:hypothetical protein